MGDGIINNPLTGLGFDSGGGGTSADSGTAERINRVFGTDFSVGGATEEETDFDRMMGEYQRSVDAMMAQMNVMIANQQKRAEEARAAEAAEALRASEAAKENERQVYYSRIDELFAARQEAENSALAAAAEDIEREMGYANVHGLDYQDTPQRREEKINQYFGQLWSSEYEDQIYALTSRYGNSTLTPEQRKQVESGNMVFTFTPSRKLQDYRYPQPEMEAERAREKRKLAMGVPATSENQSLGNPFTESLLV